MCGLHGTTKTSLYRVFLMVGYGNRDVSVTLRASLLIRLTSNHLLDNMKSASIALLLQVLININIAAECDTGSTNVSQTIP